LVRPRPSLLLAAYVFLAHGLSIPLTLALPLGWPWRLLLLVLVWLSAAWAVFTHLWPRAPWAVREALLGDDGWQLTLGSGVRVEARLGPATFVGPHILVLNFRGLVWRRYCMVVMPDGLEPEARRRLRARLRLEAGML
jgi:hypothetical protein